VGFEWDLKEKETVSSWCCSYQYGPDTYLLQLRDVDFPVRLREYMKVAANRGPYVGVHENYDWRVSITNLCFSEIASSFIL
jgi:hypothetical protein